MGCGWVEGEGGIESAMVMDVVCGVSSRWEMIYSSGCVPAIIPPSILAVMSSA